MAELTHDTSVRYIKGVGEKMAAAFARLHIHTVEDLLRHFPRAYEDWSQVVRIADAPVGESCCVRATVLTDVQTNFIRKGMTLFKFTASDGKNGMQVTLFNNKYLANRIKRGREYLFFGTVTSGYARYEMASPLIEEVSGAMRIHPIYRQTEGLTTRTIAKTVEKVLPTLSTAADILPPALIARYGLCTAAYAYQNIHFPRDREALSTARRRLVFEELLLLQLGLLRLKGRTRAVAGTPVATDASEEFWSLLPFTPTGAQRRAVADCVRDMQGGAPMSRLVQGDVGSGKTAVAAGVAYTVIQNGGQVAMMAPTEILAEQHAKTLEKLLTPAGIRVGKLTGSMPAAEKRAVREGLANGTVQLVVGTHALISDGVEFSRLGLVITDEQHRFGVAQRARLAEKGENPHLLVMSATPIPRTLALIIYGDLDVSVLDELPPGRQPIATFAVDSGKRARAYGYVKKHLDEGRQAYVVCPLVEEGEEGSDLAAATETVAELQQGALKGYRTALLHGRMKGAEKEAVMSAFARGEVDVLVSTTVIEVGVDVPNAVIMVIENADRFGLAQLHQLRGRVGRGEYASTCILISDAQNEEARRRLRVMCQTTDGFRIADEDLQLRGPGDFFGNRQHGLPQLNIADLMSDAALLGAARRAAEELLRKDPLLSAAEHRPLVEAVERLFARVGDGGMN
ncbi:MAG: ATP-dependent DNA helicase RecG [Ruminococcaceae bacterium]|nr:ATP-dependent DNA helicase RecG [Oscillospiraceae bacterium]